MHNLQFIVGFDSNARFVHLFHAENSDLPINCDELVGESLGKLTSNESDSRLLRSTFAECLFTGNPQVCKGAESSFRYTVRFEKVVHLSGQNLRPEDEIVVIGLFSKKPNYVELTQRERQIVKLICRDMSTAEIAMIAKAAFALTSNKLDFLATHLGFENKVHHEGHRLWTKCYCRRRKQ